MKNLNFKKAFFLIVATLFISTQTMATDGYFSAGYGTINKGFAGAGIAFYQGSLINGNPAGAAFLGNKYQFGIDLFNPNRQYTVTGNPSGMEGTFGLKEQRKVSYVGSTACDCMRSLSAVDR